MSGVATPQSWSADQMRVALWLKWRMAKPPAIVAIADAVLSGGEPDRHPPSGDPVVSALTALADGHPDRAVRLLAEASDTAARSTALGDALAALADWPAATTAYQRAVDEDDTDPVALIGRAVAVLRDRPATVALADLRSLRAACPADPVVGHYFALVLVCRGWQGCAVGRDDW